jgi:hypothetical protein
MPFTRKQLIEANLKIASGIQEWKDKKRAIQSRPSNYAHYNRHELISCEHTLYAPTRNHVWVAYRDVESSIYGYGPSASAAIFNLISEEEQILD